MASLLKLFVCLEPKKRRGGPINDHRSECTRRCTQPGGRRRALETGPKLPSGKVSPLPPPSSNFCLLPLWPRRRWPNIRGALLPARLAGGRTWPLLPHIPLQAARQNEGQPRSYVAKEWLTTQTVGVQILTRMGCLQRHCHRFFHQKCSNHIWDSLHVLRVKRSAQFLATLDQLSRGFSVTSIGESQTLLNLTTPSDSKQPWPWP